MLGFSYQEMKTRASQVFAFQYYTGYTYTGLYSQYYAQISKNFQAYLLPSGQKSELRWYPSGRTMQDKSYHSVEVK